MVDARRQRSFRSRGLPSWSRQLSGDKERVEELRKAREPAEATGAGLFKINGLAGD